jgi:plastocyanin
MKPPVAAVIACCALVLATGCGSSSSPASGSTTTAGTATTATSAKGATAARTSTSPSAGLKVDTKPKYAVPSSSAPVLSGVVQIAYRNIAIAPDTVRVKVGSTIRWTNYDSVLHNVTSEGGTGGPYKFASKNFGEGGTFEITVGKPGVIHYENTLQPTTMNGTIEVVR